MKRLGTYLFVLRIGFACAFMYPLVSAHAQLTLFIDTLDASGFPTIRAKVRVLDGSSGVRGLDIPNFTMREDGFIQFALAGYCEDTISTGVSVMLVIDRSGSMGGFPFGSNAIVDAKRAASSFVDRLGSNDETALLSFNNIATYDQDWTTDKDAMKQRINALVTGGGTAIWDAIIDATNRIKVRSKKKVIILLTDGKDQDSKNAFNTALNLVRSSNVIVFTIGLGTVDDLLLQQLASATGGKYYHAPVSTDLDQIYLSISREITTSGICELRYTSALQCLDQSFHTVSITVTALGQTATESATFRVPLDSSTFTYVDLSLGRDYVVESGNSITIPVDVTRISTNRPQTVFPLNIEYDKTMLDLTAARTTALTPNYSVTVTPTANGNKILLQGGAAVLNTGPLLELTFTTKESFYSSKTPLRVYLDNPDFSKTCTLVSSSDGIVTVSGLCEHALIPAPLSVTKTEIITSRPNPFNPGTWVHYSIARNGTASLKVYDMIGREVTTLIDGPAKRGQHSVYFDASQLPNGVYVARLEADSGTSERSIVLVK